MSTAQGHAITVRESSGSTIDCEYIEVTIDGHTINLPTVHAKRALAKAALAHLFAITADMDDRQQIRPIVASGGTGGGQVIAGPGNGAYER